MHHKRTKDPAIWLQYLCWWIQFWTSKHKPIYPYWLRGLLLVRWNRGIKFFRRFTGGRSHRCEFTDPEHGALYGHKEGAFMNELFEQSVERLS